MDGISLEGDAATLAGGVAVGESVAESATAIVYIVDISGSANDGGGCGGDQNGDGGSDRIIMAAGSPSPRSSTPPGS